MPWPNTFDLASRHPHIRASVHRHHHLPCVTSVVSCDMPTLSQGFIILTVIDYRMCNSSTVLTLLQTRRISLHHFPTTESNPMRFLRENRLRRCWATFGAPLNWTNQLTVSSHFPQPPVMVVSSTPAWSCITQPQITGTTLTFPCNLCEPWPCHQSIHNVVHAVSSSSSCLSPFFFFLPPCLQRTNPRNLPIRADVQDASTHTTAARYH